MMKTAILVLPVNHGGRKHWVAQAPRIHFFQKLFYVAGEENE